MTRIHFAASDIANALLHAGFDLRPEDCSTIKFYSVADELGALARTQARCGLDEAKERLCSS